MSIPYKISFAGYFKGKVTDNDSNDVGQVALREAINMDFHVAAGCADVRPALAYDDSIIQFDYGAAEAKRVYQIVSFASGITTVHWNRFIVYRSLVADGNGRYTWTFATNAPNGGEGGIYAALYGSFVSQVCNAIACGGVVRVALGPALDYMIFMNLCEDGDCAFPGYIISDSDSLPPAGDKLARPFGAGGYVYKGWLWDYGKLYAAKETALGSGSFPFMNTWLSNPYVYTVMPELISTGETGIDLGFHEWMLAPVFDSSTPQYGIPLSMGTPEGHITESLVISSTENQWALSVTLKAKGLPTYSRRMCGIAFYYRYGTAKEELTGDFLRITTIPFDGSWKVSGTDTGNYSTNVYYKNIRIDGTMLRTPEGGLWSIDSGGHPVPAPVYQGVDVATITDAEGIALGNAWFETQVASMTVKPSGFRFHAETMYAWGVDNDPGQSRIAYSAFGERRGMYDVYIPVNVMFRGDNQPVVHLEEFNDRLYLFQSSDICMISPPTANGINTVRQIGAGMRLGTTLRRTIAQGARAVYFANHESVYEIQEGGTHKDILLQLRRNEWQEYTTDEREAAVGFYNGKTEEYWILIAGRIWIYRTRYGEEYWRDYTFDSAITVDGFFTSEQDGTAMLFGTHTALDVWTGKFGNRKGKDFENYPSIPTPYAGDTIAWAIETQCFGDRNAEMLIDYIDVQRRTSGDSAPVIQLFSELYTTSSVSIIYPSTRRKRANFKTLRCYEARIRVQGAVDMVGADRLRIYEITAGTSREEKRRQ